MKILINTGVINQGGAIQVALNLINFTLADKTHDYHYIVPKIIASSDFLDFKGHSCCVIGKSPAKILSARKTRKKIASFERKVDPDIVYSVGAPSYIRFKKKEVLRLTNPFLIGADDIAFSTLSLRERATISLKIWIQRRYINSDQYVITQTDAAKKRIVKNLNIPKAHVRVVPNTYSPIFAPKNKRREGTKIGILCLAAPYPHKNLSIIPLVAKELINKGITDFEFTVTVPENVDNSEVRSFYRLMEELEVEGFIKNIGRVNFTDCPDLYTESDIVFLPTLLEVFSATHVEAMAMNVPIVTTDFDFCREICQDGALYFKPKSFVQAADRIMKLIENNGLKEKLIEEQQRIIEKLPDTGAIYGKHISYLEEFHSLYAE